jgi:hypothetical protein
MNDQKPLREQLVAAREAAKTTGVPLREQLPALLRGQPSNVTSHILRSHGLDTET